MPSPATGTSPLRVLVVDADRRVRESLCDLIRCETTFEAVTAVGTAAEAAACVADCRPDVVVIDPRLPDVDAGLGLLAHLRSTYPDTRLLVMSWSAETDAVARGADGMLDKSASPEDLVAAITQAVRRGSTR